MTAHRIGAFNEKAIERNTIKSFKMSITMQEKNHKEASISSTL
jgi:hypothetical protein